MSKIQKALQILQNGSTESAERRSRQSHSENSAAVIDDSGQSTDAQSNLRGNAGNRYLPDLHDAEERLPGFSLNVSVESLVDQGIQAQGADLELINQQFRHIMDSDEPGGRRLNFLLQELHREFNTMGSKIGQADTSHRVVDVKSELEKIREQIQNVE